jgi:hypothetical protein
MTMTPQPNLTAETDLERIDGVLADLGTIARRAGAETLDEADFRALMMRARLRLKALRASLQVEADVAEAPIDAAQASSLAAEVGRDPGLRELIRRNPGLMTARQLADRPEVSRARTYGPLAVVDGGRAEEARP